MAGVLGFDDAVIEPLVVTAKQLAIMLQVSKRTLFRMRSAGRLPSPMRVGGIVRWRLEDVQNWISAGCPEIKPVAGSDTMPSGRGRRNHQ